MPTIKVEPPYRGSFGPKHSYSRTLGSAPTIRANVSNPTCSTNKATCIRTGYVNLKALDNLFQVLFSNSHENIQRAVGSVIRCGIDETLKYAQARDDLKANISNEWSKHCGISSGPYKLYVGSHPYFAEDSVMAIAVVVLRKDGKPFQLSEQKIIRRYSVDAVYNSNSESKTSIPVKLRRGRDPSGCHFMSATIFFDLVNGTMSQNAGEEVWAPIEGNTLTLIVNKEPQVDEISAGDFHLYN